MKPYFFLALFLICNIAFSQDIATPLEKGWKFRQSGTTKWYPAEVPGTVHTDLLRNKLIPDPFYGANESRVQWVEEKTWEYQLQFSLTATQLKMEQIFIEFHGLDTYAEVFLNGKKILGSDNMFRFWAVDVKQYLSPKNINTLHIHFLPASKIAKDAKAKTTVAYPDNERVFVRKAQYQFGWDWGPRLVTAGIWRTVRLRTFNDPKPAPPAVRKNTIRLVKENDESGQSFYFTVDGEPVFIKGTNWIPADNFIPRAVKAKRYEQLIKAAKEAHVNMIRVWGGGIYEDDIFYELCDKYGILVWQDFMFAGALYPGDSAFLKNVEEEVRYQVQRLRKYNCVALWCGNNEIEEAWFNWGWQKQFGYSASDSAMLWSNYKKIFHELIPSILQELDPTRPYWPSSPSLGWGRKEAYQQGDVHYWGVWWGKEPVEKYEEKVGRFNSEYGMQSLPAMQTIRQFATAKDLDTTSQVMKVHQKHPFGYENINRYIQNRFRQPKTFEDLVYVSQLMQADALRTAILAHRRNEPLTMGTLFWQWNDCWPVVSWSVVDHYGRKKAAWYEVKRDYEDLVIIPYNDSGMVSVKVSGLKARGYYSIIVDTLNLLTGKRGNCELVNFKKPSDNSIGVDMESFERKTGMVYRFLVFKDGSRLSENFHFGDLPKAIPLKKSRITAVVEKDKITLRSTEFAYGVFIYLPDGVELSDNFFHLMPGERKTISFTSKLPITTLQKAIRVRSLADTY